MKHFKQIAVLLMVKIEYLKTYLRPTYHCIHEMTVTFCVVDVQIRTDFAHKKEEPKSLLCFQVNVTRYIASVAVSSTIIGSTCFTYCPGALSIAG